jgi:hypothetical protein
MDARIRNLREWIILLFVLFCAMDIAALQYGMMLATTAPAHPNPVVGQIVAIVHGSRGAWRDIYVTPRQVTVFYGFLGSAFAALLACLAMIVALGIARTRAIRLKRSGGPGAGRPLNGEYQDRS